MGQQTYSTSQFAHKAAVTARTLRYYDRVGLLAPSHYTEVGFRRYTDSDLSRLQQILALKFLGFSLEEIKVYLQIEPAALQQSLTLQKRMMQEKREQLDAIIQALDETEKLLQSNMYDWDALINVIQVIQMQQDNNWHSKYFTEEQARKMAELSQKHYTPEQQAKLAEWGKNFTEQDQQIVSERWTNVSLELARLTAAGADPASPEAQALAKEWNDLIQSFTHGDESIFQSMKNLNTEMWNMPKEEQPFHVPYTPAGRDFLQRALDIYKQQQKG